ncbi:MAG: cold shock domain-containing protein [Candidatus Marinimicrobia bacterium]|nr:cold shock domain-containing protein [Candidatus Neomarinimicrobiota bacterium]
MNIGVVKVWNPSNGWGFISGDDGEDYFLNANNIRQGQKVKVGDRVKFDVFEGQKGPSAENVSHA